MSDTLSDVIKQIAMAGEEANKPCDIRYGQVVSDTPLRIKITDKFILPEKLLLVPDHLRNKTQSLTYVESFKNWETNTTEYTTTIQNYQVDNSLKVYDQVILLRERGGRRYVVIGRL